MCMILPELALHLSIPMIKKEMDNNQSRLEALVCAHDKATNIHRMKMWITDNNLNHSIPTYEGG